jgi:hypothetical protein
MKNVRTSGGTSTRRSWRSRASLPFLLVLVATAMVSGGGGAPAPSDDPQQFAPVRAIGDQAVVPAGASLMAAAAAEADDGGGDKDPAPQPFSGINNNSGATGTSNFTQSETTIVAFGHTVVIGFNDSGSFTGGASKFTGWAFSTDGGTTFTDGGTLPTNPLGDAGDPVLARDEVTGRIYFSTLGFNSPGTIQMFRSDDNGLTWMAPVNATPGGSSEDKQWHTVDNFPGPGQGNVYVLSRRFGAGPGIYFFRSVDGGNTFAPNGGTLIVPGSQGAFVAVGPDHAVYAFWYAGATLQVRKSVDQGLTFGPAVTVASGLIGGTNGDLGLTGIRQGTVTASGFRSNEFPHVAVNPVSGAIYVTYNNKGQGTDKADVLLVESTDGGATWSVPVRVNDDATTTDQWMPTIAASTDGSRVGVFYYSREEDPLDNNLFKLYGRIATVSGPTLDFLPSFPVSDVASLPEFGRDSVVNATYMGDYNHAVSTPGYFHVTWSDNRDDLPGGAGRKDPNVYYAKIPLGLAVTTTVPAVGSAVAAPPTTFTVNVSEPVTPGSVDPGDFQVNGIPATTSSVEAGGTTLLFNFSSSPVTAQGLQTMTIAAGAFTRAGDGEPVIPFSGTFRYDVLTLQVISTTPAFPGGVFTLPAPFTLDVTFNEPIAAATVQPADLLVTGLAGAAVTGASVLNPSTVRFTLTAATEGTLTVTMPPGAITDTFGNPGLIFTASYAVDLGTVPYPIPLAPKNPPGSLIYDPVASGIISPAGDTDAFWLPVDPDQTITVLVSPTVAGLQPTVELRNPSNAVIASATAAGPGQPALIQTAAAPTGGAYTIAVGGGAGTTGSYALQVGLNMAVEEEGLGGFDNDSLGGAQNIDASFIELRGIQTRSMRGAVMGTTDRTGYTAAAVPFAFADISATGTRVTALDNADDSAASVPIGFSFPFYGTTYTSVFASSNGLMTFVSGNSGFSNADLTASPAQAAISPFWDDLHTGTDITGAGVYYQVSGSGADQRLTIQWHNVRFFSGGSRTDTITFQAQLYADGRIQFNYPDLVSSTAIGNNGGSATVGVKAAGAQGPNRLLLAFNNGPNAFVGTGQSTLISPPEPTTDHYAFTAGQDEILTLALTGPGGATLELVDGLGAVLATGAAGTTNVDVAINNAAVGATGTYYARIRHEASAPYSLVVLRNAAFDLEPNDDMGTAQDIADNVGVLGAIGRAGAYSASSPPGEFEDISATGTIVAGLTNADDAAVSIPIGFPFPFYGSTETSAFVSSNGLVTFGSANTAFSNADLTSSPSQGAIAVFWDDLHTGGGLPASGVYYQVTGTGAEQRLTIQWNQVRFFSGGAAGDTLTFQAQLYQDGRIRLNYPDLVSGAAGGNNGASATVGVKNAGTQGPDRLLLAFNNGPNAFVGTGVSTVISRPAQDDWYSMEVTGRRFTIETRTPADGPGEFVNVLDPKIGLYDLAGNLLLSGETQADGRNEIITTTELPTGRYLVRVSSENDTVGEYYLTGGRVNIQVKATIRRVGNRQEATIVVRNHGTVPADGAHLTMAVLGGVPGAPIPIQLGSIPARGSATAVVTFTGPMKGVAALEVAGTFTGGSFDWKRNFALK